MNLRTVLSSLKTMNSNGAGKITLIKGQIFSGKILKLFPNSQALVQLGGLQVHAKLEASLEAGKSYWLQVANSSGIPELRVIEDKETQLPARNTIESLFEKMGIGSTKNRETVVRTFMNAELPFSKEMIIKSGEWLKTVESQADALKVIKEMAAKQLPFSRAVFQSLLVGEQGEPISKQIARLAQALGKSDETSEPAKKLAALLPELTVEATDSSSANKQSLQHVIARLGLSYEHNLLQSEKQSTFHQDALKQTLQQILQQTNASPELKQQATQLLSQLSSESALTASSLQKMIQPELEQVLTRIMAQTDSSEPTQNALKLTDMLKPLLMQIVQQTHSSDVRQSAQQLLGQLTSQQLNAIGPFQTIIQFPFQIGTHQSNATLKWEGKKKKNGQFDPDFCRILFYLELEHLQETAVDVNIQKRFVTIRLYNETHQLKELIERFEPMLKKNLESVGYHLSSLMQAKGEPAQFERQASSDSPNGVDLRI